MSLSDLLPRSVASLDFGTFLDGYREKLRQVFRERLPEDQTLRRGLPPYALRMITEASPLSVWIPSEYGGRGGHVKECLSMLQATGYESLPLCLTFGINGALFIQPVSKYASESVRARAFEGILEHGRMGGLMITEPSYGSDALNMKTGYTDDGERYHLRGTKHWAGLSGWADYWLVTARAKGDDGELARDIDFFVVDLADPDQRIHVEEYYNNLGLYVIPYGLNTVDARVPHESKLQAPSTGIKMMLDLLHRSRMEFPGMGIGFINRMLDEAISHTKDRLVGGKSLASYDQVRARLAEMQAYFTAVSAFCLYTSEQAPLSKNLAKLSLPANVIKTTVTDYMQRASQSLLQLKGAMGYRIDDIAGRATVDSRPFQIFEGANDILYQQISEAVLKQMRRAKQSNLGAFLSEFELTSDAAGYFKNTLDFSVDMSLPQRKLVDLGQAISRIASMNMTLQMGERVFRADLIQQSLEVLKAETEAFLTNLRQSATPDVVMEYQGESAWLSYTRS
jgi:alkylation response protein AidB-like acyl-CoA dehydrogenase